MQSWPGEENYAVSTMNQCAKLYSCVFNQKRVDVRSGSKKKSPKTVKIKSRNASFANLLWIPQACVYWISRRIGRIFEGDVDSTASSCARNLLLSLGRFLMLQHRNWWKEWLNICSSSPFRRLTKAYWGGFVGGLQQLKHRILWAHLAFNGAPTHPSIYRASLSNANGVVCPCTQVLPLHRRLSLFIRWNPDLFFVGPFPNDVGYSRSCFPEKKSKKSDSIDYLCPSSYDGIGKMGRFN